jgi:exopolysaccharide production protein ExoZ
MTPLKRHAANSQPGLDISARIQEQPRPRKSGTRKLPAVQMLRGIAAAMVVFHHIGGVIPAADAQRSWILRSHLTLIGGAGVDIFFVISGFIMLYTHGRVGGRREALSFLWKRALRIYPLYWLWTSVLILIAASHLVAVNHVHGAGFFLWSYLLIPVFNGFNFHPFLDQGWTLSFEMLFYLVFTVGIWLNLQKSLTSFLAGSLAAVLVLSHFLPAGSGVRYLFSNTLVVEFLFGVGVANVLLQTTETTSRRISHSWLPAGLVVLGSLLLLSTLFIPLASDDLIQSSWRFAFWGLPSSLIVAGFVFWNQRATSSFLVFLGDASYSTYLVHTFALGAFLRFVTPRVGAPQLLPADLLLVGVAVATIALTLPTYRWVEKPLTSLLRFASSLGRSRAELATCASEVAGQTVSAS